MFDWHTHTHNVNQRLFGWKKKCNIYQIVENIWKYWLWDWIYWKWWWSKKKIIQFLISIIRLTWKTMHLMFVNATDDQNKKPIHYCMKMNLFLDRSKFFFYKIFTIVDSEWEKMWQIFHFIFFLFIFIFCSSKQKKMKICNFIIIILYVLCHHYL